MRFLSSRTYAPTLTLSCSTIGLCQGTNGQRTLHHGDALFILTRRQGDKRRPAPSIAIEEKPSTHSFKAQNW